MGLNVPKLKRQAKMLLGMGPKANPNAKKALGQYKAKGSAAAKMTEARLSGEASKLSGKSMRSGYAKEGKVKRAFIFDHSKRSK